MSSSTLRSLDPEVLEALASSLDTLAGARVPAEGAEDLSRFARILRDYAIPRVNGDHALDVVFAGPTGSGKSTLVNSLSGLAVSAPGVLRPTTSRPLILTQADRSVRYQALGDVECDVVEGEAAALQTMTLIDTPDLDSTATHHRAMAEKLVDVADVVVFVVSALRYADLVPWQVLRRAAARGSTVIPVLNRVTPAGAGARVDFVARLRSEGLDHDLFVVPEQRMTGDSRMIPRTALRSLSRRLVELSSDRRNLTEATVARVIEHVDERVRDHLSRLTVELDIRVGDSPFDPGEMDLSLVAGAIGGPHPADGATRHVSRWRRRLTGVGDRADLQRRVEQALSALLTSEGIRASVDAPWSGWRHDDRDVAAEAGQLARAWLDFTIRVCDEAVPGHTTAEVAHLARAAADPSLRGAEDPVFGEELGELADRVERDLRNRLAMALERSDLGSRDEPNLELARAIEETEEALARLAVAAAPANA